MEGEQTPGFPLPRPAPPSWPCTHRSRSWHSWHCWRAAPWALGARTDARGWRPAPGSGAGGWDLSRACEKPPGSGPRVGRMTRPRRGGSPGRSHPGSWATLRPGSPRPHPTHSSCRRGAHALWGAEAAGLRGRESPPLAPRRRLGAGPRAPPPSEAGTGTQFPLQ